MVQDFVDLETLRLKRDEAIINRNHHRRARTQDPLPFNGKINRD